MSEPRFTPGPWRKVQQTQFGLGHNYIEPEGRDNLIMIIHPNPFVGADEVVSEANADLTAAAPDLLAALQAMEKWTAYAFDADDPDMDLPELEQARAAIAKALGEQAS